MFSVSVHADTCVCVCFMCSLEKPAAGPVASLTANELGWASVSVGAERALSPATQLSLADLQLSDYVTVA